MAAGRRKVVKDVNVIADSIANQYGVSSPTLNGQSGGSLNEMTKQRLQNKSMVKTLKYKNPLNKGNPSQNSKSPTPPPLKDGDSNNIADTELAEVDTMDFNALIGDDDDDDFLNGGNLAVPPSAFDSKTFGQYSIDLDVDDLGGSGIKSIFDTHKVDVSKFKKAAPPQKAAAPSS